eukprot:TRINITY_DN5072_c0_g2_i1.p1 TRINITY_DN5072_c0_g2~~TRINITY_DN5072_c0_g2_i1.p1  ORF type:complete len:340 (-),score=101.29 TRINITY_DN5072_c0_g2_i1:94-1113(-)
MNDEHIKKSVWEGAVPISLNLSKDEVTTMQGTQPVFILASRLSYLPLVTSTIRDHFASVAPAVVDEVWFDYKSVPLKWHYPVGVLFDLYATQNNNNAGGHRPDLPWDLTLHFQGFPSSVLLRCPNDDTVKQHYNNVLKEANYIKHGDGSKVNKLSLQEVTDMWEGLRMKEYERFFSVNRALYAPADSLKHIPLRVCLPGQPFLQDLIPHKNQQGGDSTLAEILAYFLPELYGGSKGASTSFFTPASSTIAPSSPSSPSISSSLTSSIISSYVTPSSPPRPDSDASSSSSSSSPLSLAVPGKAPRVIIQGINPPLETPILWLSENMSHPDNFLYIIVRTD